MKLMDDNEFLESYVNILGDIEGKEGGDTTTDIFTRELGIVNTLGIDPADYPNNPRGLAKAVAEKNIQELKRIGVNWDELPLSMKYNALDMQFNFGSLNVKAKNYLANLKTKNYAGAINETLDALSASDPKDGKQRPVKGIALRRAKFYNLVASDLGIPLITSVDAVNQDNAQKSAKFTYKLDDGKDIVKPFTVMSLHSRSVPGAEKVLGFEDKVVIKPTGEELPVSDLEEKGIGQQTESAFPMTGDEQYLDQEGPIRDTGELVEPEESRGILDRIKDFISPDTDEEKKLKEIRNQKSEVLDLPNELSEARDFSVLRKMYEDKKFNEGGLSLSEQMDTIQDPAVKQDTDKTTLDKLKDVAKFGAEFIPGVGEAMAVKRVSDAMDEKDYVGAGIETAAGALGLLPIVGDVAGKGLRVATKKFRKADVEEAEKLIADPKKIDEWRSLNKLPESQRQKNIPEAQQAAEDLFQNKIKSKEARKQIKDAFPEPKLYTSETMPEMPTVTDVVGSMGKKSEKGILGVRGFDLEPGQRVGARLDIPAYNEYDKWVVSIHDGKSRNGSVVGYGQAIRLKNIEFGSDPKVALDIAKGKRVAKTTGEEKPMGKATIARVFGDYVPEDPYELQMFAKKILADKDSSWTQVGMNPYRGSYFYDKATGTPITRADEVIQVGPLVLAKNVTKPKVSELKQMFKPAARTTEGKLRIFSEGGAVPMKEQMSMFDDGGLMDEGNTIDPISGNDVPPGSTQEEVRDDIPAQLSEGEFVFPADVVRYIGLEKLMQMRQQAKMGLQTMDDMGQMGNSEEAVMPDNLPFELSDLDMDDDPVEMNTGGVAGVSTVPSQVPATSFVQAPEAPTVPTPAPTPTASTVPIAPTYTPPTQQAPPIAPDYSELAYKDVMSTPELAARLVDIINPTTGEKRTINFIPGVTPIPDGFVLASEYTAPDVQATSVTPTVGQAQVRKDDDDDRSADESIRKAKEANARKAMIDELFGKDYSATNFAPTFADLTGGLKPGMVSTGGYLIGDNGEYLDPSTGMQKFFGLDSAKYAINPSSAPPLKLKPGGVNERFIKIAIEKSIKDDSPRRKGDTVSTETGSVSADMILDSIRKEKEEADAPPTRTPKQQAAMDAFNKQVAEARAIEKQKKEDRKDRETATKERYKAPALKEKAKDIAQGGKRRTFGGFKEGGLASKPKPKPKKMRQGGLASR